MTMVLPESVVTVSKILWNIQVLTLAFCLPL